MSSETISTPQASDDAKRALRDELVTELAPVLDVLRSLDPCDPEAANTLNNSFPLTGPLLQKISEIFARGIEEGSLCYRDGGPKVRYSRVAKELGDKKFTVDAVRMQGPALGHTHPQGEFDLCLPVSGEPLFDGHRAGWTVYEPGTWHIPTVDGGTMNILYFLPEGSIEFGPKPS